MKLIQNKDLLTSMHKYMFMQSTMKYAPMKYAPLNKLPVHVAMPTIAMPTIALPTIALPANQNNTKPFVPFQKDKLFWCFYIILHGYEEYEMIRSNAFSVEKQIKIKTVEKLKSIKDQLKELKLKRTELEDELVNKQMISLKGLCALCLVHNVSITYIFGRKYCEIIPKAVEQADAVEQAKAVEQANALKQGIIVQNEKKEDSLKWTSNELHKNEDFLTQIRADYWLIENIQKPLNAPSAYTLPELQEIANKLQIATHIQVNEKSKTKTKTALYEEILQTI